MKLVLSDMGGGKIVYAVTTTAYLDRAEIDALTDEQRARLEHHIGNVSDRVYAKSVAGMFKGVRKYGPEPRSPYPRSDVPGEEAADILDAAGFWLPHIFEENIDSANDAGLFADALGVEV